MFHLKKKVKIKLKVSSFLGSFYDFEYFFKRITICIFDSSNVLNVYFIRNVNALKASEKLALPLISMPIIAHDSLTQVLMLTFMPKEMPRIVVIVLVVV